MIKFLSQFTGTKWKENMYLGILNVSVRCLNLIIYGYMFILYAMLL